MFMIVCGKRHTGLNVEGHQERVKGEVLRWSMDPCYLNKEFNLNQTKQDYFVERVVKNNGRNHGICHKVQEIFQINCFVLWYSSSLKNSTQLGNDQSKAHLMEKNHKLQKTLFHSPYTVSIDARWIAKGLRCLLSTVCCLLFFFNLLSWLWAFRYLLKLITEGSLIKTFHCSSNMCTTKNK